MDRLDLIIKALDELKDDQNTRMTALEESVRGGFAALNGRVRKTENALLKIKTIWAVVTTLAGVVGYLLWP